MNVPASVQTPIHLGQLRVQIDALGLEHGLVDGPADERADQAVLVGAQLRSAAGEGRLLPITLLCLVQEHLLEGMAEPRGDLDVGQAHPAQVFDDRLIEILGAPSHHRVIRARMVVGAAIVEMLPIAATPEFAFDALAGDQAAAVGAAKEAIGQGQIGLGQAAVLPA